MKKKHEDAVDQQTANSDGHFKKVEHTLKTKKKQK